MPPRKKDTNAIPANELSLPAYEHPLDLPLAPGNNGIGASQPEQASYDIADFSGRNFPQYALRPYQLEPARAIISSVERHQLPTTDKTTSVAGGAANTFAVVFSRQSGKDELIAQLNAFLLAKYAETGGQIIMAAPGERQVNISRDRLKLRLTAPALAAEARTKGYIVKLGNAEARFLSAAPTANVRGETASLLLVANEAQDIDPDHWDAVFDPMSASTNATTVFMGTVWTPRTLLSRQMRHLRHLEATDGVRRLWLVDWLEVEKYLPAYGERVRERIGQFGENHPFLQTEYFLRELDGTGGLFPPERRALMQGSHGRQAIAKAGKTYCLLVDVAGESEEQFAGDLARTLEPNRDSTAVTVVEVVPTMQPLLQPLPSYRVVNRYLWTGIKHADLYSRLLNLAREVWHACHLVIDATGIGAPLASFLEKALPLRVIPFVFTSVSKSELGYNFVTLADSSRYLEYAPDGEADTNLFWEQLAAVEYNTRSGAGRYIQWGVPSRTLHDDLVMSAALTSVLDSLNLAPRTASGAGGYQPLSV